MAIVTQKPKRLSDLKVHYFTPSDEPKDLYLKLLHSIYFKDGVESHHYKVFFPVDLVNYYGPGHDTITDLVAVTMTSLEIRFPVLRGATYELVRFGKNPHLTYILKHSNPLGELFAEYEQGEAR